MVTWRKRHPPWGGGVWRPIPCTGMSWLGAVTMYRCKTPLTLCQPGNPPPPPNSLGPASPQPPNPFSRCQELISVKMKELMSNFSEVHNPAHDVGESLGLRPATLKALSFVKWRWVIKSSPKWCQANCFSMSICQCFGVIKLVFREFIVKRNRPRSLCRINDCVGKSWMP